MARTPGVLSIILGGAIIATAGAATWAEAGDSLSLADCVQDMSCYDSPVDAALLTAVRASSTLGSKTPGRYAASNLVDEKEETAWCEGVQGPGVGQWVELELQRPPPVDKILITPMYAKSLDIAAANGRVKRFRLTIDGDVHAVEVHEFTIDECLEEPCLTLLAPQHVDLGGRAVQRVRLTIDAVEEGAKYADTCLSTLHLVPPEPAPETTPRSSAQTPGTPPRSSAQAPETTTRSSAPVRPITAAEAAELERVDEDELNRAQSFHLDFPPARGTFILADGCALRLVRGGQSVDVLSTGEPDFCEGVAALAFRDLDGDGDRDILALTDIRSGGAGAFHYYRRVDGYTNTGQAFAHDPGWSGKATDAGAGDQGIGAVLQWGKTHPLGK